MSRFIEGADRSQTTLFPECLDDYVAEEGAVRVVDVFVDELDLSGLGFKTEPSDTGRPAYHPATLLKIYIYGYLNRIQSSRRLEREAQRNVELMWLTGRLAPDFKTIADFRKDNGEAIRLVCREFVMLCRKLELFSEALVAVDGSKFKADNNRGRNYTRARMKRRLQQVDEDIDRYLKQIASADRQEGAVAKNKAQHLAQKVAALKAEMARLKKLQVRMLEAPDQQVSLTDPDARAMALSPGNSGLVGYNVQTAVDAQHHLIVAHEVSNKGSDRKQLFNMASQAKAALGVEHLDVVADRGYFRSEEILACDRAGINAYVPKSLTSNNLARGFYDRSDFIYKPEDDAYECPAGERLTYRFTRQEQGKQLRRYWSTACDGCTQKSRCTTGQQRRVSRWEHEAVLEAAQQRLDRSPEHMRVRRSTVEHPFGTLKSWMGHTHFLTRTLPRVSTEMSLHVLAYNLKRVMAILGPQPLIAAMRA
jgi:transposase